MALTAIVPATTSWSGGEAGLMSLTGPSGNQPAKVGDPITDLLASMYGAFALLAALDERTRTDRRKAVRTSLLAAAGGVHAYHGIGYAAAGAVPVTSGAYHPFICPHGLFHATDEMVQIAIDSDRLCQSFPSECALDRAGCATNEARVRDCGGVIEEAVNAVFSKLDRDDLIARLAERGVPPGPIRRLDELYAWCQVRLSGFLIGFCHPALGRISLLGPPLRYADIGAMTRAVPPTVGQHSASIRPEPDAAEQSSELDGVKQ